MFLTAIVKIYAWNVGRDLKFYFVKNIHIKIKQIVLEKFLETGFLVNAFDNHFVDILSDLTTEVIHDQELLS